MKMSGADPERVVGVLTPPLWERERERDRQTDRDREMERERETHTHTHTHTHTTKQLSNSAVLFWCHSRTFLKGWGHNFILISLKLGGTPSFERPPPPFGGSSSTVAWIMHPSLLACNSWICPWIQIGVREFCDHQCCTWSWTTADGGVLALCLCYLSQLGAAVENLKHIFNVPETVRKCEELITEGKLLHAHKW